jgi:uncharacterized protein
MEIGVSDPRDPASPCTKICRLDPQTNRCVGCYRTIAEIAGWSKYSAQQKTVVLRDLARRRSESPFDPPAPELPRENSPPAGKLKQCGRCGAGFVCSAQEPHGHCWCDSFPHIMPLASVDEQCLCPQCLGAAITARLSVPPDAVA